MALAEAGRVTGSTRAETDAARRAREEYGREMQQAWRCPLAGCKPGPIDDQLSDEARHVAQVTGADVDTSTCPFAGLADPWAVDVQNAAALAADLHIPVQTTLGRDLTAVDLQAIIALQRAKGEAFEHERQRQAAESTAAAKRGRGGA